MNAPYDGPLGFLTAGNGPSPKARARARPFAAPDAPLAPGPDVAFRLNGDEVIATPGETIIEVADRVSVSIPRLCYKPGYRPDGNCRACMVEIKGERVLFVAIGVTLIVRTTAAGGGVVGYILGALFVVLGVARFTLERKRVR